MIHLTLPNFSCDLYDSVDTKHSKTTGQADDNWWRNCKENDNFDPHVLQDNEKIYEKTGDKDNESSVEQQPGQYL